MVPNTYIQPWIPKEQENCLPEAAIFVGVGKALMSTVSGSLWHSKLSCSVGRQHYYWSEDVVPFWFILPMIAIFVGRSTIRAYWGGVCSQTPAHSGTFYKIIFSKY